VRLPQIETKMRKLGCGRAKAESATSIQVAAPPGKQVYVMHPQQHMPPRKSTASLSHHQACTTTRCSLLLITGSKKEHCAHARTLKSVLQFHTNIHCIHSIIPPGTPNKHPTLRAGVNPSQSISAQYYSTTCVLSKFLCKPRIQALLPLTGEQQMNPGPWATSSTSV
jgi:hypothetical protein